MTPANREELVGMLTRGFATSGVAFWTDATTSELLDALDAAGVAILPKEPTDWMSQAGIAALSKAEVDPAHYMAEHLPVYHAMLEASPYRGKG
jgi:hypothetical protein